MLLPRRIQSVTEINSFRKTFQSYSASFRHVNVMNGCFSAHSILNNHHCPSIPFKRKKFFLTKKSHNSIFDWKNKMKLDNAKGIQNRLHYFWKVKRLVKDHGKQHSSHDNHHDEDVDNYSFLFTFYHTFCINVKDLLPFMMVVELRMMMMATSFSILWK